MPGHADEGASDRAVAQDARQADDEVDRELVGGARCERGPPFELAEGETDDGAGLDAGDGIEDQARDARGHVDEVLDAQLDAAPDLEPAEEGPRQRRKQRGDRRERDAIVAAIGIAAHHDPDGRIGRHGHHGAASTERSRKWVAHEMHGS